MWRYCEINDPAGPVHMQRIGRWTAFEMRTALVLTEKRDEFVLLRIPSSQAYRFSQGGQRGARRFANGTGGVPRGGRWSHALLSETARSAPRRPPGTDPTRVTPPNRDHPVWRLLHRGNGGQKNGSIWLLYTICARRAR